MYAAFTDSRDLLGQPERLRARLQEDGYLFIAGLLPQEAARETHEDILHICREQGWADDEGRPTGPPRLEGSPEWFDVYDPLQRLESFHALAHHPALLGVAEVAVQEQVLVHPRNIARITFPGAAHFTTPAHQDFVHIQGARETYSAWIPLCDCPIPVGGLALLAGSHRVGLLPVHPASGPGGVGVDTDDLGLTWHAQDMQPGDCLFFHSHTIHGALPNISEDGLRVSVDYRYQGVSQPIVDDSLLPHYARLSWDDVYQGWQRADLQYYWRRFPLQVVARQPPPPQPAT